MPSERSDDQSGPSTNGHTEPTERSASPSAEQTDRLPESVDMEHPPRLDFVVVGVGASAGGLEAYVEFLQSIKPDCGMAFVLIQHLSPKHESLLAEILSTHTTMPVLQVVDGMSVEPNQVYIIRPGYTLTIHAGRLHLGAPASERGHRRPVDDFFRSLAEEQRERAICVILSGTGSNGTAGAQAIKAVGGICIAQDPDTAKFPSMPRSLIDAGFADSVLRVSEMFDVIARYASHPYARGIDRSASVVAQRERLAINEIFAVLRTRVRHDFSGYKRPTLVRRIQRRMGLLQTTQMSEYAKSLRQTPSEVAALADDLMIHVTGFFRDADVWDILRKRVIEPLVAERPDDSAIRVWVTACSSGEEAYTIAILIVEAAEAAGKQFDVKIFATDTAERSLTQARAGLYPGGIESEITPDRLDRFFEKDNGFFRVKKQIRELVVFAPQNVLQDPPFSRLDLCTCRNLLIYLEADVQRRVLSLLHFGLREGGALLLGNSETVGDADHLFEPIDKKARLFRRVGPTRHGTIDFPLRQVTAPDNATPQDEGERSFGGRMVPRATIAQVAVKTLLDKHTPAAVVVDRQAMIVYFHGDTDSFLEQPRGEPTREVLTLAREHIRGSLRTALHKALEANASVTVRDGVVGDGPARKRIELTVAPLDNKPAATYFLISFREYPEPAPQPTPATMSTTDADVRATQLDDELRRVRDELQSTVEELQTSNEEMKASHEEITSINEELQSANEELETSKEELQSLNEELTTVNAQLQAKVDEVERTGNDLASLLSSTDIAVVFLDAKFRVRRYTPPTKDLIELIPSDLGRPINDLARKFDDPTLLADAQRVLDRLTPLEHEVESFSGRWYIRRVLPYRTTDNRIAGVVITFVDITERKRTVFALRDSEERYRVLVNAAPVGICEASADGHITFVNDRYCQLVGRSREALLGGTSVADLTHPNDVATAAPLMQALRTQGTSFTAESRYALPNGSQIWVSTSVDAYRDENGQVARILAVAVDITARREAEDAVRASAERLRRTIGVDVVGVVFYDNVGRLVDCNDTFLRLEHFSREELLSGKLTWRDVTPAEWTAVSATAMHEAITVGRVAPSEKEYLRKDGSRWWGIFAIARVDENTIVEYVIDATAHHNAKITMVESEARFRIAAQAAAMGFFDWELSKSRMRCDDWCARLLNIKADADGFVPSDRLMELVHPDDRKRVSDTLLRAVERREDFTHEYRVAADDGKPRWLAMYGRPVADASSKVTRVIGCVMDVTARKSAETEHDALLERERNARESAEAANRIKDDFLATLSHELRTPLSAIMIWTKLLRAADLSEEQRQEGLDAITQSAEAQRQLIEDLLDSSRISSGKLRLEMADIAITELLRGAIDTIEPTADSKGIEIGVKVDPTCGNIRADGDRVRQIIWNLLANAVKFTPAGGTINVEVTRQGKNVEIRVSDNGRGIEPSFLPHVFERFSQSDPTASRSGGGIGLGLAIAQQLVELHGGTISADSAGLGKGSTFRVTLPLRSPRGE